MTNLTLYKQIHPCQCQNLAKLGYKSLVNLRFDDEVAEQPKSADLAISAKKAELVYQHIPTDIDGIHLQQIKNFADVINKLPKPVMVFCGTGSRAKRLYQSAVVCGLI